MATLAGALSVATILGIGIGIVSQNEKRDYVYVDGIYNDFHTVEQLILGSSLIVVAELLSETEEKIELVSPIAGPTGNYEIVARRVFVVKEVIKGETQENTISVDYAKSIQRNDNPQLSGAFDYPDAQKSETYVLFLLEGFDPGRKVETLGPAGEPSQAVLQGQALEFQTTERYRITLEEARESLANQGGQIPSGAVPFSLSLPELRDLSRFLANQPVPSLPLVPEPTPGKMVEP